MPNRIEKIVELRAPVARVWRALTDHVEFGLWFRVKLDGPFAVGETSTGHITYPGYEHLRWEAIVERMEEPRLFSFRWHPYAVDPDADYSQETRTLVEFTLEPIPTGTRCTIVESGFDALPDGRRAEAWRMNDNGWALQCENMRQHVEA